MILHYTHHRLQKPFSKSISFGFLVLSTLLLVSKTASADSTCEAEYAAAIARVKAYDGSVADEVLAKVKKLFPKESRERQQQILQTALSDIETANHTMEFNRIGNKLYEFPGIHYAAVSLVRLAFTGLAKLEKEGKVTAKTLVEIPTKKNEGGIGFTTGWKTDASGWADQLNKLFSDKGASLNPRVLTTLAYSYMYNFRDAQNLKALGPLANQALLKAKQANLRCDIFQNLQPEAAPVNGVPLTTQPHGWPWLKYLTWNVTTNLGKPNLQFIGDEQHKKSCEFKGLKKIVIPSWYNQHSLKESDKPTFPFQPGYDYWGIADVTLEMGGKSANWYQQNKEKYLPMLAGPSSTTSGLYEYVRLLNLPVDETPLFRLLMLTWMIQGRDHSFTEIMGAFDAYALEQVAKGPEVIANDAKVAWKARVNRTWHKAYNDLLEADISLPELKAASVTLAGQSIKLPTHSALTVKVSDLNELLTGEKDDSCYPSYYASDNHLKAINTAAATDKIAADPCGLLSEPIGYCAQDPDTLMLFDPVVRKAPPRRPMSAPASSFLDTAQDKAYCTWVAAKSKSDQKELIEAAASILAESGRADSVINTFARSPEENPVWNAFLNDTRTTGLSERLCPAVKAGGENCFYTLTDSASGQATLAARAQAIVKKVSGKADVICAMIQGASLAVTHLYTQHGDELTNPGYGPFTPPANASQLEAKLDGVLKKKQYKDKRSQEQAKEERDNVMLLLTAALEAPLYVRNNDVLWHAVHPQVATAFIANRGKKTASLFPGYISTTYDATEAAGWLHSKGTSFQIEAAKNVGSHIAAISAAPNEKEVLYPLEASFQVKKICEIFLEDGEYPAKVKSTMQKTRYNFQHGKPKKMVIAPEGTTKAPASSDSACQKTFSTIFEALGKKTEWEAGKYTVILLENLNAKDLASTGRSGERRANATIDAKPLRPNMMNLLRGRRF